MKSKYKLGDIISLVDKRNTNMECTNLKGLSMTKEFRPSTSNIVGTDLSKYKIVEHNQFAVDFMSAIRVHKMPIALNRSEEKILISPAYAVFEVKDESVILTDYLMMWFLRSEFDRYADFRSDAAIRGGYGWNELCDTDIEIPSLEEQKEKVFQYKTITDRIALKQRINENLTEQLHKYLLNFIEQDSTKKIGKLKDYSTMQYGYTETALSEDTGTNFLRITDIAQSHIDWNSVPFCKISDSDLKKYHLSNGDVVVARTGATVGVAKMIGNNIPNSVFASFLVRIRPIDDIYKYYFGLLITSKIFLEYVRNNAGGSAQPQANPPLLGEFELIIPDKSRMSIFNDNVSVFLKSIEVNEFEISKLNDISKTLITMISSC